MTNKRNTPSNRGLFGFVSVVLGFLLLLAIPAQAQLAGSGTPGDRAVYTIGSGESLASGLGTNTTHVWPTTTVDDLNDSFDIDTTASRILLTGGHHLVLYGTEYTGTGTGRGGIDSFLKVNGTPISYGASSGFKRDGNNNVIFSRGGTIIDVAQGDYLEVQTERTDDVGQAINQEKADLQLVKLDDNNLDYLRLGVGSSSVIMSANGEGPAEIVFDTQDEIDNPGTSFDHDTTAAGITLKDIGKYLVLANTGFTVSTSGQRNCITQDLLVNGSTVNGGRTVVYVRNTNALTTGAASLATIIQTTTADSVLTVSITRDNDNSNSSVSVDPDRTGIAILKLPDYGDVISIAGAPQDVNAGTTLDFNSPSTFLSDSFNFDSGNNPAEILIEQSGDYLFFASHYAQSDPLTETSRSIVEQGFESFDNGIISYGSGGIYNRDDNLGADRARFSGAWAGAVLAGLASNDGISTITSARGQGAETVTSSSLAFQGINIASISSVPVNPIISTNNVLNVLDQSTGNVIGIANLSAFDSNAGGDTNIQFTVDFAPAAGDLRLSGSPLTDGSTFTQDDLVNNRVTYDHTGFSPVPPDPEFDSFDFTVNDLTNVAEPGTPGTFNITIGTGTSLAKDEADTDEDTFIDSLTNLDSSLLNNDTGSSLSVVTFDSLSANGATVTVDFDGIFSYDPSNAPIIQALPEAAILTDTFTYTARDFAGNQSTTTVCVTVGGINDAPNVFGESLVLTDLDSGITTNLLNNDSDVDEGAVLLVGNFDATTGTGTFPVTFTSANGAVVTVDADGGFIYDICQTTTFIELADGDSITEMFDYVVVDDQGAEETATVSVTTSGAPGASTDIARVNANSVPNALDPPVTIAFLSNDTVAGGTPGTATTTRDPRVVMLASGAGNTDSTWNDTQGSDFILLDNPGVESIFDAAPTNVPPGITAVYDFSGSNSGSTFLAPAGSGTIFGGDISGNSSTFEVVIRPADQVGNVSLWEMGGTGIGSSLCLFDNQLIATFGENSVVAQAIATIPAGAVAGGEFVHVIVIFDDPNDEARIYVNGSLAAVSGAINLDTGASVAIGDWSGGDMSALARSSGSQGGNVALLGNFGTIDIGTPGSFDGEMATFRVYNGILTDSEIQDNALAVFGATSPALAGDIGDIAGSTNPIPGTTNITLPSGALLSYNIDGTTVDYEPNNALVMLPSGAFVNADDLGVGLTAIDTFTYSIDAGLNGTGTVKVQVLGTNTDAQINLTADAEDYDEGTDASFTVSSSIPASGNIDVTITYTGVAQDGSDFTGVTTATILNTQSSANFIVPIIDDGVFEGPETFTAAITGISGNGLFGLNTSVTATINDVQSAPEISIASGGNITEGESGTFTISSTQAADEDITLTVAHAGTAQDGFDIFVQPSITLPAGTSTVDLVVPTANDGFAEGNEDFSITISGPNIGSIIGNDTAAGDVVDGSAVQVFLASFDTAGVTVNGATPTTDPLTTGNFASTAVNNGTEIGSWSNVSPTGTLNLNGIVLESNDSKGLLGFENLAGAVAKSPDQVLTTDRPPTSQQTGGTQFIETTANFVDALDFSGSNKAFIAFDIGQRRTSGDSSKNSELLGLDAGGNIVLRLIVSGYNTSSDPGSQRLLAATDLNSVDSTEASPSNWFPLGRPLDLGFTVGNNQTSETTMTRVSLILSSTGFRRRH